MTEKLREELVRTIARSMPGWNDDTEDGMLTAHWERVNETCLEMARGYVDPLLPLLAEYRNSVLEEAAQFVEGYTIGGAYPDFQNEWEVGAKIRTLRSNHE